MVAHFPPFRRNLANEYPRRPGSLVTSVGLAISEPRRCKCLIVKWIEYRRHLALAPLSSVTNLCRLRTAVGRFLPIAGSSGRLFLGIFASTPVRASLGGCFLGVRYSSTNLKSIKRSGQDRETILIGKRSANPPGESAMPQKVTPPVYQPGAIPCPDQNIPTLRYQLRIIVRKAHSGYWATSIEQRQDAAAMHRTSRATETYRGTGGTVSDYQIA